MNVFPKIFGGLGYRTMAIGFCILRPSDPDIPLSIDGGVYSVICPVSDDAISLTVVLYADKFNLVAPASRIADRLEHRKKSRYRRSGWRLGQPQLTRVQLIVHVIMCLPLGLRTGPHGWRTSRNDNQFASFVGDVRGNENIHNRNHENHQTAKPYCLIDHASLPAARSCPSRLPTPLRALQRGVGAARGHLKSPQASHFGFSNVTGFSDGSTSQSLPTSCRTWGSCLHAR